MKWKILLLIISYKMFCHTFLYLHIFLHKCIIGVRNSCWSLCLAYRILYITLLEDNDNFTDSDVRLVLNMLTGGSTGYTTLLRFLSQNWDELRQRYVHLNSIPSAVMRGNVWKLYFGCMVNCFRTVDGTCPMETSSVVLWTALKLHIHSFIHSFIHYTICRAVIP